MPRGASFAVVHARYRRRMHALREKFPGAVIRSVAHHRAHGLYALAASGYQEAAVLITDSLGETCTTSIGHGRTDGHGVRYRIAETISDPASLGYAYGAVTAHLGWRRGDEEGTVMALAALGDPARFRNVLACAIRLTRTGFALDAGLFPLRVLRHGWARVTPAFIQATCPPRRPGGTIRLANAYMSAAMPESTQR